MDRQLSADLYAADFAAIDQPTTPAFHQATAKEAGFDEDWLQLAIARNPELVLGACRAAGLIDDEAWSVWDREVRVDPAGNVDVLLVSESGRVGLVETKLSYNPEGRRSVIAQALEYAIHFPDVDPSRLPPIPEVDGRPFADAGDVQRRIRDGDYLLIVAGDRLDSRAVKLGQSLLGRHLVHGWTLAMVEVSVYQPASPGRCLLVPHIRGTIVPEERHVVRVVVEGERTRVTVDPGSPVSGTAATSTIAAWDEGRFVGEFRSAHPHMVDAVQKFIGIAKRFGSVEWKCDDFKGTRGKLNVAVPALGPKPLFRLFTDEGWLAVYVTAADKSVVAKANRQAAVARLIAGGAVPPPDAGSPDVIELDFPDWSTTLDALEAALADVSRSPR